VGRGLEVLGLVGVEVLCVQGSHDLGKLEGAGHVMGECVKIERSTGYVSTRQ
jgi:hypothetical protein